MVSLTCRYTAIESVCQRLSPSWTSANRIYLPSAASRQDRYTTRLTRNIKTDFSLVMFGASSYHHVSTSHRKHTWASHIHLTRSTWVSNKPHKATSLHFLCSLGSQLTAVNSSRLHKGCFTSILLYSVIKFNAANSWVDKHAFLWALSVFFPPMDVARTSFLNKFEKRSSH